MQQKPHKAYQTGPSHPAQARWWWQCWKQLSKKANLRQEQSKKDSLKAVTRTDARQDKEELTFVIRCFLPLCAQV
jgi:hypothetical protein